MSIPDIAVCMVDPYQEPADALRDTTLMAAAPYQEPIDALRKVNVEISKPQ